MGIMGTPENAARALRPELRRLAYALAQLQPDERELVISQARQGRRLATVPWDELWKVCGSANVGGGDAVADCEAVHDE